MANDIMKHDVLVIDENLKDMTFMSIRLVNGGSMNYCIWLALPFGVRAPIHCHVTSLNALRYKRPVFVVLPPFFYSGPYRLLRIYFQPDVLPLSYLLDIPLDPTSSL